MFFGDWVLQILSPLTGLGRAGLFQRPLQDALIC